MLTRVLAKALAPEVRVCGVAPGPVAVEPRARRSGAPPRRCSAGSARPRTSPEAVSYLAGAGFVTGTTLVVDGGRLLQIRQAVSFVDHFRGDGVITA